jgi:2-polyprenyl-3-methyl-5-hydroxy-6-metoxy-1,4-benzoquinol methylase
MSVRNVESTDRQKREIAYHREHAERHSEVRARPISAAILSNQRRWWNAFWETYRILRRRDIAGKKIMVPGCGFGEDAIKLALLGADVYAFDLSADILAIAIERADRNGASINVAVMPAEALAYDDNFF